MMKGPKVELDNYKFVKLPSFVPSKHTWVFMSTFLVVPKLEGHYELDARDLVAVKGPSCLHCEQLWSPEVEVRPCTAEAMNDDVEALEAMAVDLAVMLRSSGDRIFLSREAFDEQCALGVFSIEREVTKDGVWIRVVREPPDEGPKR